MSGSWGTLADFETVEDGIEFMRCRSLRHEAERAARGAPDLRRLVCQDCNCHDEGYMVEEGIWLAAHPAGKKGLLCLHCLEVRLGRPLAPNDFTNALINLPILWGMRMATRSS